MEELHWMTNIVSEQSRMKRWPRFGKPSPSRRRPADQTSQLVRNKSKQMVKKSHIDWAQLQSVVLPMERVNIRELMEKFYWMKEVLSGQSKLQGLPQNIKSFSSCVLSSIVSINKNKQTNQQINKRRRGRWWTKRWRKEGSRGWMKLILFGYAGLGARLSLNNSLLCAIL